MIEEIITNKGETIDKLSSNRKVMLVFLRHFGCTFCRESLTDILKLRRKIEDEKTQIVLVHQMSKGYADRIMEVYDLSDIHRISDPDLILYDYFRLKKGTLGQLLGPKVWLRAISAGIFKGHLVGSETGNGWQMPGVFIIYQSKVINEFVHKKACDRPDYVSLARTPIPETAL